jgi:hypothetical protein
VKFYSNEEKNSENDWVEFRMDPANVHIVVRHTPHPFFQRIILSIRLIFNGWEEASAYITHQQAKKMIEHYGEKINEYESSDRFRKVSNLKENK